MAQGMAQCTDDQSRVWYHSAIQAPPAAYYIDNNIWQWTEVVAQLSEWAVTSKQNQRSAIQIQSSAKFITDHVILTAEKTTIKKKRPGMTN